MIATDLSQDARLLADFLLAVPIGGHATIERMSATIDRDIRKARYLFYTAMRVAERESGAVFACERNVGYRRLASDEIPKLGSTARSRIRGVARRSQRAIRAGLAGANDVSAEVQREAYAELSSLGLIEHISRDRSVAAIQSQSEKPQSVAATANAFLQSIGAKEKETT